VWVIGWFSPKNECNRGMQHTDKRHLVLKIIPSPYLLLVIATVIWGGNFVVGRAVHEDIGPLSLNFWRWVLSGLLLAPYGIWGLRNNIALIKKHIRLLGVLAFSGMVMFHSLIYAALHTTSAINAGMVLASMPLVIPVVSFIAAEDRLSLRQGFGIAISFVGVGVIITRGNIDILLGLSFAVGDILVLAAVVMWSVYSVLLKRLPKGIPPMVVLATINWMAVVMLLPGYLWELSTLGGFQVSSSNMMAISYVAIFASIIAFVSWNRAVQTVGPNRSGLFIHVIPISSAVLAIIFLGETIEVYHIVGIVPIVIGILLTTYRSDNKNSNRQGTSQ